MIAVPSSFKPLSRRGISGKLAKQWHHETTSPETQDFGLALVPNELSENAAL
jgi:hypothetical protein